MQSKLILLETCVNNVNPYTTGSESILEIFAPKNLTSATDVHRSTSTENPKKWIDIEEINDK